MIRPANRIGGYLIFPNGGCIKLTWWERLLYKFGLRKTANWDKMYKRHYETWYRWPNRYM